MPPIESYLQSEQAEQDVAALIRGPQNDICAAGCNLVSDTHSSWRSISWYYDPMDRAPTTRCYFRPDGDRYIVTDLGEAARALRMRSGRTSFSRVNRIAEAAHIGDNKDRPAIQFGDGLIGPLVPVSANDLPRAIVRVMLATHRVAHLSVA